MSTAKSPAPSSIIEGKSIGDKSAASALTAKLFASRKVGPNSRTVLTSEEILFVIKSFRQTRNEEISLLELQPPLIICGDIHGDYINRGKNGIETLCLLYLLKVCHPESIYLLRGNHETRNLSLAYGFSGECNLRSNMDVFEQFQIFCTHGGISPLLTDLDAVRKIKLPRPGPVEPGLLADLLWADPKTGSKGFNPNYRGISVDFGEDTVEEFCRKTGVELILRGHQVVPNGYEYFAGEKLITIFSAPNYCGEFINMAAVISVDKNLNVRIHQIKPIEKKQRLAKMTESAPAAVTQET